MTLPFSIQRDLGRGWWFFLLKPNSKAPLTAHGVHDSTNDMRELSNLAARFPGCGWGLDAGRSNLLIIDLDGDEGRRTWAARYGNMPPTRMSLTGSGGLHLLYADPTGVGRNSAKKLGLGIDTRGRGGYIVAPPSVHPNGTPYRWQNLVDPVQAPNELLRLLRPETGKYLQSGDLNPNWRPPVPRVRAEGEDQLAIRILNEECDAIARAGEGIRNDTLHRGACRLLTLAFGGTMRVEVACNALLGAAISAGLPEGEAKATIRSAMLFAEVHPRTLEGKHG